ncbi:prenyltransferase/squalene oxidase repeat-containing protein [Heyndrickxia sp. NPDC080065]|uniref:terpene cyclase/mutase family protein n=1 Tax=Heyndrickxia sp. NPDC080065 TaxID=3390568 RepID=UPI003D0752CA
MKINENVNDEIQRLIQQIIEKQSNDGTWKYCFESGPMTDSYLLMLLRIIEYKDEELIKKLYNRLINTQQSNGAWKLFDDDGGNLSATVEAYTALLYSGFVCPTDLCMKKAESFILDQGGLENTHPSTKFMLALHNHYPWPRIFPLPLFLLNIPSFFPINFFKFSSYVRAHLAPILILGYKKFTIKNKWTPDISHLYLNSKKRQRGKKGLFSAFRSIIPNFLSKNALNKAETYMLKSIEEDGTLYSYASATFYLVYALLALGYRINSPLILHAIEGLKSMIYDDGKDCHLQNSPSTIWDTALVSYALQESGTSIEDPVIQSSAKYLQSLQQVKKREGNSHVPGGWGFSESNTSNPDIDDTQAALRAISRLSLQNTEYRKAWKLGVNWLLAMQNEDGGWGAFEKNQYKTFIGLFPIENFKDTAIDPSTADLTGRTLEFLGNHVNITNLHPKIQSGVNWLLQHQESNGSWYGRWGVSYIYGTWAAVTGLMAVGVGAEHPSIQKSVQWLMEIQQPDGGWGESCKSDKEKNYIPLSFSTIVQTSWALDALISTTSYPTHEIEKGIDFLTKSASKPIKSFTYPTGAGLPGHFYIYYHSYNLIWPLLTLSNYRKKFIGQ